MENKRGKSVMRKLTTWFTTILLYPNERILNTQKIYYQTNKLWSWSLSLQKYDEHKVIVKYSHSGPVDTWSIHACFPAATNHIFIEMLYIICFM